MTQSDRLNILLQQAKDEFDRGRYEEAIASYDRAIKIKPDKDEAWYNWHLAVKEIAIFSA